LARGQTILVLNGPNLNLLGTREPTIYGRRSLADIEKDCAKRAKLLGLALDFRQSNHEGDLSNIFRREPYRRHSFVSEGARGVICGLGPQGYELALDALADIIGTKKDA
jgi:3-dehydroquinate dehydratase II